MRVGYSIFKNSGEKSISFKRPIEFDPKKVDCCIEYAIYWDYDIQHLYELEHVWIYIDKRGKLVDAEASFHGYYIKALLKDRSNIEDETHLRIYSQPGKHAFLPKPDCFELIPDLRTATYEDAGSAGLLVVSMFEDLYETDNNTNKMVQNYLKKFKFRPSMKFNKYVIPEDIFITWDELYAEIPNRIAYRLEEIKESEKLN